MVHAKRPTRIGGVAAQAGERAGDDDSSRSSPPVAATAQPSARHSSAAGELAISLIDRTPDAIVICDRDWRIIYANLAFAGYMDQFGSGLLGRSMPEVMAAYLDADSARAFSHAASAGESWTHDVAARGTDGTPVRLDVRLVPTRDARGGILNWAGIIRDVSAQRREQVDLRRLATAIDQMPDVVYTTDATGAIEYVNPAFERVTGYSGPEALGRNPRFLKSGIQGPALYKAMWSALTSGTTFMGDLTNRHKDGSLFIVEAMISPVRGQDGAITGYVAVNHDVTRQRAAEDRRARDARERALVATALASLTRLASAEATADAICQQVVRVDGLAAATLMYFGASMQATTLGFVQSDAVPVPLRLLPLHRSETLYRRALDGPWVEVWVRRSQHPYERVFRAMGVTAVAYAPLFYNSRLIGLLSIMSADVSAESRLTEILPALLEFAGIAGALIGPLILDITEAGIARAEIDRVIREAAFGSVFQPIVDLKDRAHIGYEALTRFSSGVRPDLMFAEARVAGLEAELELATLAASISAAAALPSGAWLSLNVSPALVVAAGPLASVLAQAGRPLVLEVTEHVPIVDYVALRDAIGRLVPQVRVAVDDAGAGVANFNHIVELKPDYVKADLGIVRGVDTDPTRQALVLGLLAFARKSQSQLIAEGIETNDELAMLRRLRVPFGQGNLLGRPAPAAEWIARADALAASAARDDAANKRDTVAGARDTVARARDEAAAERDTIAVALAHATAERDTVAGARDEAAAERDTVAGARDEAAAERDAVARVRDEAAAERDAVAGVRDETAAERDTVAGVRDETAAERDAVAQADADSERARLDKALRGARLDDLTGLDRRKAGRIALTNEIDRARRGDGRFAVAFVDVDGLKRVNDRDGHDAGDQVLRTLATVMRSHLRSYDVIVRYGGDEFVCGLGGLNPRGVSRRFRAMDQALQDAVGAGISVGLAYLAPTDTLDLLIARADAALLSAKQGRGGDRRR